MDGVADNVSYPDGSASNTSKAEVLDGTGEPMYGMSVSLPGVSSSGMVN